MSSPQLASERQDDAGDHSAPTTDEIFHVLQNERRRNALRYLQGKDEPVRMRDLAEQVAAWEHDTTVVQLSSTQRQRVYIPLYQSHLPKLDEMGVITYQQNRGIVQREPRADLFDPYLDPTTDQPPETKGGETIEEEYYIAVTAFGAILLLGSVLELPVLSTITGIVLASVLISLLAVPSAVRVAEKSDVLPSGG